MKKALSNMRQALDSKLELLDQLLGLRSWGLILYGALPASLSLLGILDVKIGSFNKILPILLVSLLPLSLTFMLIRARQRDWYFTTDYLNVRSSITTLLIVMSATVIAGASGVIRDKYVFSLHNLTDRSHVLAMGESFLFGMASLVISSTLFATILTKEANLPGLPATDFVKSATGVRQTLIGIQLNPVWKNYEPDIAMLILDDLVTFVDKLRREELTKTLSYPGHRLAIRPLRPLESDLLQFVKALRYVKGDDEDEDNDSRLFRWQVIFADLTTLDELSRNRVSANRNAPTEEYLTWYAAGQRIKTLRLGGANG
jgi:hypothetical protein